MITTVFLVALVIAALGLAMVGFVRKDRKIWLPSIMVAGIIAAVGIVFLLVVSLRMP